MANPKNEIVQDLDVLLADHQVFYQKLRGYHWNVRGPRFFDLHAKFEELYLSAAEQVDSIAERIATLGTRPTSTMGKYLSMTRLSEDTGTPAAQDMVRNLLQDFDKLSSWAREVGKRAGDADDLGTANLLDEIADAHEKQMWMLRASLES